MGATRRGARPGFAAKKPEGILDPCPAWNVPRPTLDWVLPAIYFRTGTLGKSLA